MNSKPIIRIDYLEEKLVDYRVIECTINESLSQPIEIETLIFFKKHNIWSIDVILGTETRIHITEFIENKPIIKEYSCFIEKCQKKKYFKDKSFLNREYLLIINFAHKLKKLSYKNNYTLWKNKTYGMVLMEIMNFHHIELSGNLFSLMKSNRDLIVQYGEIDLDFFQRILKFFGYYYVCDEILPIVKVFDNEVGYEEIVKDPIKFYKINYKLTYEMGTISYINEIKNLTYEKFINRDFQIEIPLSLEGISLKEDIGYGEINTYPSNSTNNIEVEKAAENKKKMFIDRQYEGESYCFDFKPGKRILIEDISDGLPEVITHVTHHFIVDTTNNDFENYNYWNDFKTIISNKTYVDKNTYKEPKISSMQVGVVKSTIESEEIDLKDFSKILVKFPWIKDDPLFYCWIPVGQNMAGKAFGSFIMPRKDDEILIYFVNGNPSQPIVYGSLHTSKTPRFCQEIDDKYKIFLMRSHTFYNEGVLSSNEISMSDKLDEQTLFFKAEKDLNIEVGHKNQMLKNHYRTAILGLGHKTDYIENGDYEIILERGDFKEKIRGNQETMISPSEKGGDKRLFIEDGKWEVRVDGMGGIHISTTGPCHIKSDNHIKIDAVGRIEISSEEEIKMMAPKINIIGDEEVSTESGKLVMTKSGGDISDEAVAKISRKSGIEINDEAVAKISRKSGDTITDESVTRTASISGGEIIFDASMLIGGKAGMEINFEAGMNIGLNSGLHIGLDAGIELGLNAGISVNICGGIEVSIDGGIEVGMNGGLISHIDGGLSADIMGGLSADVTAGLQAGLTSGLIVSIASGLEVAVDAGLSVNITSGLIFQVFSSLLTSISTVLEVVVRRPRLF
jgi:type VI secretion system secreted protein VgrG